MLSQKAYVFGHPNDDTTCTMNLRHCCRDGLVFEYAELEHPHWIPWCFFFVAHRHIYVVPEMIADCQVNWLWLYHQ